MIVLSCRSYRKVSTLAVESYARRVKREPSGAERSARRGATRRSGRYSVAPAMEKLYHCNYTPYNLSRGLVIFIPSETHRAFMYIHDHVSLTPARYWRFSSRSNFSARSRSTAVILTRTSFPSSRLPLLSLFRSPPSSLRMQRESLSARRLFWRGGGSSQFALVGRSRERVSIFFSLSTHPTLDLFQTSGSPKSSLHTAKILPPTVTTARW